MKTISLGGSDWTFAKRGGEPMPATVPGCNYHDLLRAGIIEDPFYGENEMKSAWVGESDFDYARTFTLAPEDLSADRVELSCAMLDTLCRVYVNDILVGEGQNTHIHYAFDVTDAVHAGENALRVEFDSPVRYAKAMAKQLRTASDINYTGRTHIRKAQCHFGWDFEPHMPISGITGEISLKLYTAAKLLPMEITQKHESGRVTVCAKVQAEAFQPDVQLHLTLLSPEGDILAQGENEIVAVIEKPALWWTHDLGEQPLYTVKAEALFDGRAVDRIEQKIGLRTIVLNREKDEFGHDFQFVLNGVPIFAKGANWVPPDVFPERATTQVKRAQLEQCLRANMNMLRVWGGAYYETDEFYDMCDRMGLLVWQDFAFACAPYPFFSRPDFLQNVKDEVTQNVIRLRSHASLACWSGNNELEAMAVMWLPYRKLHKGTGKFFWDVLPGWVKALDSQTPFTSTSPTGSAFMKGVQSDREGDTHLWHVWHGLQPIQYFRRRMTRFCSEFGMESLPSMDTVRAMAPPEQQHLNSPALLQHQKCMNGHGKILYYLLSKYRLPKDFDKPSGFPATVYFSQLIQAECVRFATELWRRNRGRCNGSLFWQLNDSWPASDWASIDYLGKAKALQYWARHFNAPVSLSIDEGRITVLNDTTQARDLILSWQLMDFAGQVISSHEQPVQAMPLRVREAAAINNSHRDHVLRVQLKDGDEVISERTLLSDKEKNLDLPRCAFTAQVQVKEDVAYITIQSDKFARHVLLESELTAGDFSDNFIDLFPGEPVTLTVNANGASAEAIQASLRFITVGNIETHSRARSGLRRLRHLAYPAHAGSRVIFRFRESCP